jgi:predicted acylesterase/phospholipase RssA
MNTLMRQPLAILVTSLVSLLALHGCVTVPVGDAESSVYIETPTDVPLRIRTLGADHRFLQPSSATVAQRLHARYAGSSLNILALSGGGAGGAFGAGALVGLTRSGSRPQFAVVTGVSAGALVAPYAFLGADWDAQLVDAYTNGRGDHLLQPRVLGAIFGSSLYRGAPLMELVDRYVSDAMITAVAREAAAGRLLLVATTNVDTGQPEVWDLGAIAMNGGAHARTLFRDVLVASASVPGVFPPVIIRVAEDGESHDEAHVDGGTTVPFFVPPAFSQTPPDGIAGTPGTAVYVIVDGRLSEAPRPTKLNTRGIVSRSVSAGMHRMMRATLELTAATAQLQGAEFQYSAIPVGYPNLSAFDFRADTMRSLFRYASQCAEAGRLWSTSRGVASATTVASDLVPNQNVPCPADDAFNDQFATRDAVTVRATPPLRAYQSGSSVDPAL